MNYFIWTTLAHQNVTFDPKDEIVKKKLAVSIMIILNNENITVLLRIQKNQPQNTTTYLPTTLTYL